MADVCMWMEHIGLGEHARNMQSHRISGKELVKLQQDDLEEVCDGWNVMGGRCDSGGV